MRTKQEKGENVNIVDMLALSQQYESSVAKAERKLNIRKIGLTKDRDRQIKRIRRDIDLQIQKIQFFYKLWAVALPPILPALIGIAVFFRRLLREREGIERARLK